jgi:hypothetical protein
MVLQPFDFLYPQFYNFSMKQLSVQNHQITEINSPLFPAKRKHLGCFCS